MWLNLGPGPALGLVENRNQGFGQRFTTGNRDMRRHIAEVHGR
jgi:hypothetical protein